MSGATFSTRTSPELIRSIDWDVEAMRQSGEIGGETYRGVGVRVTGGLHVDHYPVETASWIQLDAASGDKNPNDHRTEHLQSAVPKRLLRDLGGLHRLCELHPLEALRDRASNGTPAAHDGYRDAMAGDHSRCGLPAAQYSGGRYGRSPGTLYRARMGRAESSTPPPITSRWHWKWCIFRSGAQFVPSAAMTAITVERNSPLDGNSP
jgi:hypothetical protein